MSGAFSDLGVCQALCEQRPSDTSCPLNPGTEAACSVPGALCSYGPTRCLCTVLGSYGCLVYDPRCNSGLGTNSKSNANPGCNGETCSVVQDIVVVVLQVCSCENGLWACSQYYA